MSATGSNPPKHVVIVGGGLIGLTSALFLTERGATVTIVDAAAMGSGASQGNAGFFAPGQLAPLAAPGMVLSSLKSLTNPDSALRIRPRALPSMIGWGLTFMRASNERRFRSGQAALARLNSGMDGLLDQLAALGVAIELSPEVVVPFHDVQLAEHYLASCQSIGEYGVPVPAGLVDGDELRRLVPALTEHVRAGFMFPADRAADPRRYVVTIIELLRGRGVEMLDHRRITGFESAGSRVNAVVTDQGRVAADEVVLAAGAGIRAVGRKLGLNIPVIPGQGYNVALPTTERLQHPVICEEVHAVATPFADRIRLGGTMEFAGDRPGFDQRRVDAILRSMRPYFDWDWSAHRETWAGSRPMSSDGLPIIGRPRKYANLVVAGGHGMYGYTLAPVTGRSVAELIVDGRASVDLSAFDPDR